MIKLIFFALLFVGALCTQTTTAADECKMEREAVLLHNIKELDFTLGKFTASRRVAAVPQLECVGGSASGTNYEPFSVRCVNIGNREPHWRCESTLDDKVKLGHATVSCEGYEGPLDPYVLRDSCGLKYTLDYTNWIPYMLGHAANGVNYFVLTPLKWGLFSAALAFVGLVVLAAIRKPAHRQKSRQQNQDVSFWQILFPSGNTNEAEEEENEKDDEGYTGEGPWKGRLRDRRQIHSPYKDNESPYNAPPTTGLAAR